jgi:mannose-6-phosphate isomerase
VRLEPFRIEPTFSPRLWGSRSLAPLFPQKTNLAEPIGEAWLTDVNCRVATGPFVGKTLAETWREIPATWRGSDFSDAGDFPLLVKFIFPTDKLSIQVHPDDTYASIHEKAAGGRGKTEMWHIISAKPGASLLLGLKPGVGRELFVKATQNHELEALFERHFVQAGDTFFIRPGTPHTIGADMVICEVQQYSDLTYRVYDYDRVGADGKLRELHIEKALQVMSFDSPKNVKTSPLKLRHVESGLAIRDVGASLLAGCKYFAIYRHEMSTTLELGSNSDRFDLLVFLDGTGQIVWSEGSSQFRAGECWFLPASLSDCSVMPRGQSTFLEAHVPHLPELEEQLSDIAGFSRQEISGVIF